MQACRGSACTCAKAALALTKSAVHRYERAQRDQGQHQDLVEECEERLHSAQASLQSMRHEAEQLQAQMQVRLV